MMRDKVRSRRLLVTAIACAAIAACGQPSSSQGAAPEPNASAEMIVNADNIRSSLQECNIAKLTVVLQDVLGSPASAEVLTLLDDLWSNPGGDPAVAACIKREVVRVYVANALAQAHSNRMFEVSQLPSVLEALRAALNSRSAEVVQIGMMGLGDFLTPNDVVRLGQIAAGPNPANARVAVSTLGMSCTPGADNELDRVAAGAGVLPASEVSTIRGRVQEARRIKCSQRKN
jgi:hypothetical protein